MLTLNYEPPRLRRRRYERVRPRRIIRSGGEEVRDFFRAVLCFICVAGAISLFALTLYALLGTSDVSEPRALPIPTYTPAAS